jgi:hypothetical protein
MRMTEDEYQTTIQTLMQEVKTRARDLVDYLMTQPPKRVAMTETEAMLQWVLERGATYADTVLERRRRRTLKQSAIAPTAMKQE